MTTTTAPVYRPRFVRDAEGVIAPCCGINHRDAAEIGRCDTCGAEVARSADGKRIHNITRRGTYQARKIACWAPDHVCDAEMAALRAAERAQAIASGEIVKGATVEVVKGRKVAKGTRGVVRWIGVDAYSGGDRLGLAVEGTEGLVYIAASNCRAVVEG
jgi:hypothetical protein